MKHCSSSSNRDVDTDDEVMQNTDAESLNAANEIVIPTPTIDTRSAYGVYNTTAFTADTKSETIVIKPTKEDSNGSK